MKRLTLLFTSGLALALAGCAIGGGESPDYPERANEQMKKVTRSETETSEQAHERKLREQTLGEPLAVMSERDVFEAPRLMRNVPPLYPAEARKNGIEGHVNVAVVLNEIGEVETAAVVSSTDAVFEASALAAVKQWKFTAARRNGQPIRISYTVPIQFSLH